MLTHSPETTNSPNNSNKNNNTINPSLMSKNDDNCASSTLSEEQNFPTNQKSFFLSSPQTLPLDGSRKVSDVGLESQELFSCSQQYKRAKKDSVTLDETETKNSQNASEELFTIQNDEIQEEQQKISEALSSTRKTNEKKSKSKVNSHIQLVNNNSNVKRGKARKSKTQNEDISQQDEDEIQEEGSTLQQTSSCIPKKKKIRKACRFNYIEYYINHHQLSHRIETDEIIFENESFIPSNYQPSQYFNGNPISFFTLVNIHKRVQRAEHIFNNKKKNNGILNKVSQQSPNNNKSCLNSNNSDSKLKQQQQQPKSTQAQQQQEQQNTSSLSQQQGNISLTNDNNNTIKSNTTKPNIKSNSSSKKSTNNNSQQQSNNNTNSLHKKKDYVNIVFEDRTHFQKSSLNQFIKKIKSLPGKGASLYSEAIDDFIQNKISLQKTVSYDLLDNFIDGLGNFYLLRVFKQTTTDLIIDHYTLSSSLIRLLGFETPTFCSYVTAHGVPYIHDVTGHYLEYIAQCMKTWVRSSENITRDSVLICADSLRIDCSENIYTRTFHNAEKQEYYLVETHVFRPKKNDSKDYLLSDERIKLFQASFEPFNPSTSKTAIPENFQLLQQQQSGDNNQSANILNQQQLSSQNNQLQSQLITECKQESIQLCGEQPQEQNNFSANEILNSIIINLTQNQSKTENIHFNNLINNESIKKPSLKRRASELAFTSSNNGENDDSVKNIEKKLCKYRFI